VRSISHHILVNDGWPVKVPSSLLREGQYKDNQKWKKNRVEKGRRVQCIKRGEQTKKCVETERREESRMRRPAESQELFEKLKQERVLNLFFHKHAGLR